MYGAAELPMISPYAWFSITMTKTWSYVGTPWAWAGVAVDGSAAPARHAASAATARTRARDKARGLWARCYCKLDPPA